MPDPISTPTVGPDQTTGPTGQFPMGLISKLLRTDQPESTKRAIALLAACTLCLCEVILVLAVWWQALMDHTVDGTLCTALGLISASVAGLAGVAYRKPEGGAQ